MLRACSASVFDSRATSPLSVASRLSSSARFSSLSAGVLWICASILPMVSWSMMAARPAELLLERVEALQRVRRGFARTLHGIGADLGHVRRRFHNSGQRAVDDFAHHTLGQVAGGYALRSLAKVGEMNVGQRHGNGLAHDDRVDLCASDEEIIDLELLARSLGGIVVGLLAGGGSGERLHVFLDCR